MTSCVESPSRSPSGPALPQARPRKTSPRPPHKRPRRRGPSGPTKVRSSGRRGRPTPTSRRTICARASIGSPTIRCRAAASASRGTTRAPTYIAREFKRLGLKPAGDNGTYFQNCRTARCGFDSAASRLHRRRRAARGEDATGFRSRRRATNGIDDKADLDERADGVRRPVGRHDVALDPAVFRGKVAVFVATPATPAGGAVAVRGATAAGGAARARAATPCPTSSARRPRQQVEAAAARRQRRRTRRTWRRRRGGRRRRRATLAPQRAGAVGNALRRARLGAAQQR